MASTKPLSIFFLVRSLEVGGAERQLTQLAVGLQRRGHEVKVGVFYRRGSLASELERAQIPILDLAKRGRWDLLGFLIRLRRSLALARPDIIYSFLGGANIMATAVRFLLPGLKVAWSVRGSDMDLSRYDWTHRLGARIERLMSGIPDIIIANSGAGRDFAIRNGFPSNRTELVPNGIETSRFRPDATIRDRQRNDWGLTPRQVLVGLLARLDPMKDHATFLRAAGLVAEARPNLCFACVGDGLERPKLESLAVELGIADQVLFTGQADPVAALNAFDVACSSSITEGFPNAVAEAMACGKPCVVTDVGDSALIVGDCGIVVPAGDPKSLALGIMRGLDISQSGGINRSRQRIVENFSVDATVEATILIFRRIVERTAVV